MDYPNERIDELRECYARIRDWHLAHGPERYAQRMEQTDHDSPYFKRYLAFLQSLPPAAKASSETMAECARELLSGCLEWSYVEADQDTQLHFLAKTILSILEQFESPDKPSDRMILLKELRNRSASGDVHAQHITVHLTGNENAIECYSAFARVAYSDVTDQPEGLGGFVALADTNAELQFGNSRQGKVRTLIFRNAKAMHLEEVRGDDTIVALAQSRDISILNVQFRV